MNECIFFFLLMWWLVRKRPQLFYLWPEFASYQCYGAWIWRVKSYPEWPQERECQATIRSQKCGAREPRKWRVKNWGSQWLFPCVGQSHRKCGNAHIYEETRMWQSSPVFGASHCDFICQNNEVQTPLYVIITWCLLKVQIPEHL